MTSQTDHRYKFSRCSKCGATFQNIDFGCASHRFTCEDFEHAERMLVSDRDAPFA